VRGQRRDGGEEEGREVLECAVHSIVTITNRIGRATLDGENCKMLQISDSDPPSHVFLCQYLPRIALLLSYFSYKVTDTIVGTTTVILYHRSVLFCSLVRTKREM
jgi:hypothetical protein